MRTALLCLLSLAGCDRVFGLSRDPDAVIDGAPVTITGRIVRRFLHNNAQLEPVADAVPYAASELIPRALIGDAEVDVAWDAAAGTLTFTGQEGATNRIVLNGHEYQATATHLELEELAPTRPDAEKTADAATTVDLQPSPAPSSAATVRFTSTGVWSDSIPTPKSGSFSQVWVAAHFADGRSVMLDAAANDALYYVERETTDIPPILAVTKTAKVALTMVSGTNQAFVTPTVLARPYCVTFDAKRADELARLDRPNDIVGAAIEVFTVPRLDRGLTVATSVASESARANVVLSIQYGMPFPGQDTLAAMETTAAREVHGTTIGLGTIYTAQVTNQAACVPIAFPAGGAELPVAIKLASVELKTDDVVVGLPATLTELTWSLSPGATTPDRYVVQVSVLDGTNPPQFVRLYFATERRLVIDPAVFDEGKTYVIRVSTQTGFPMARSGDHTVRTMPYQAGFADSAPFRVSR